MSILIDPPVWAGHGRRWSHLVSDTSLDELHVFARVLGIPARGFEGDHYDLPEERYASAVRAGAIPVTSRELIRRLLASGLRRSKRRGEKVLASVAAERAGARVRLDTLLSPHPPIGMVEAVYVVLRRGRDALVLPDDLGFLLPHAATAGEPAPAIARRLIGSLLEQPGVDVEPTQLGFLRAVAVSPEPAESLWPDELAEPLWQTKPTSPPGSAGPPTVFEVVLQVLVPAGAEEPGLRGEARWVDAHDAAALLPLPLAPLLRHLSSP